MTKELLGGGMKGSAAGLEARTEVTPGGGIHGVIGDGMNEQMSEEITVDTETDMPNSMSEDFAVDTETDMPNSMSEDFAVVNNA